MLFAALLPIWTSAHDFEVDGIYYELGIDNTVQVTHQGNLSTTFTGEYAGEVVIPDHVCFEGNTYKVTSIDEDAFYDCSEITSVIVGNNVTTIGRKAFGECTGLITLTLGTSVTTLDHSFYKCTALSEIVSYATTPPIINGYGSLTELPLVAIYVPNNAYDSYKADATWSKENILRFDPEIGDKFYYDGFLYRVVDSVNKNIEVAYRGAKYDYKIDTIALPENILLKNGNFNVAGIGDSVFYSKNIGHVIFPITIAYIGNYTFYNTNLSKIDIPNNVVSIGNYAFNKNTQLASISIGSGVTTIGEEAFSGCTRLTSIICNATVPPTIKSSSFYGLNQVPLIVPQGCKEAYQSASYWRSFGNIYEAGVSLPVDTKLEVNNVWYKVTDANEKTVEVTFKGESVGDFSQVYTGAIVIPDSITYAGTTYCVTAIGENAFHQCKKMTSLTIGSKIAEVATNAFTRCEHLENIVVNTANTTYDSRDNCNAIVETATNTIIIGAIEIQIPQSVTAIGNDAFYHRQIKSITIPSSITHIGEYAFYECGLLEKVYITDIAAWCNITFDNSSANPLYKADKLYLNDELLTELIIPESVAKINNYAFYKCSGLSYLSLGNGVTSIGDYAFAYCDGLFDVTIPTNITFIGNGAFYKCTGLRSIQYNAENCAAIETPHGVCYPFQQCENFRTVVIGDNVKIIPSQLFRLSEITDVTMGDNVMEIGSYAFAQCEMLSNIKLSKGIVTIQSHAFAECTSLTTFVIPDNTTTIGRSAFYKCKGLYDVTIGSGVENIEQCAFEGCIGLKNLTIADSESTLNIDAISYAAFGGPGQGMFNQAPLETIYLGRNITYRKDGGYSPFYNRKELTTVTISNNVTYIPDYIFGNCPNLTDIYCYSTVPPEAEESSFSNYDANLYVPCVSLKDYQMDMVFGTFKYIQCNDAEDYEYYYITYLVDGEIYATEKFLYGEEIVLVDAPTKEGHTFSGWSEAPKTMPEHDITISGTFTPNIYKVYYYVGEELVYTAEVTYGKVIPEYIYEPGEGYTFLGWIGETYETMPAHDVTYKANIESTSEEPADEWSEWSALGTAVTTDGKDAMISNLQYWGYETNVAWEEPITIDQRTNVADPTKKQLRLNGIFNAKDIILDYDSSTSTISAEMQSTGYATNMTMIEGAGVPNPYEEFVFSLRSGTYRPMTGVIDLSNAFFYISDMFGFQLGFSLQIEGVTPPTFTGTWNRKYVGREGGEATLTVSFDEPIVKYRKLVLAPGESLSVSALSALYAANPVTDLVYEESNETTISITCTEMGTYRVVLIPIGADGTAVLDYKLASIVSYAEPEYETYTWNYIGESTVIEAMGSNLIATESMWEEVDGEWINKYTWQTTAEGVQTYRRADNPNIIGLRNLYGGNHPYSSKFIYVDQSQDWWVYIDITDPENVKLLTTPVGAISSQVGYGTFINQYADAGAATLSDGVITFPYGSVLLGNVMNQDFEAEFDMKVVLPENVEDAITGIETKHDKVEYFNLKGQRIGKPDGGLYIERSNGKVIKRF